MSVSYCLFLCITLRALDILSDEVLVELSAAYRRTVSHPVPLFAYCGFFLSLLDSFSTSCSTCLNLIGICTTLKMLFQHWCLECKSSLGSM